MKSRWVAAVDGRKILLAMLEALLNILIITSEFTALKQVVLFISSSNGIYVYVQNYSLLNKHIRYLIVDLAKQIIAT